LITSEFLKQFVLQKENEDVDPGYAKYTVNREALITEMVDLEKLREAEDKAKKQTERANKLSKELDTQKEAVQVETLKWEGKMKDQQKKEEELTTEIANMKKEMIRMENVMKERIANAEADAKMALVRGGVANTSLVGSGIGAAGAATTGTGNAAPGAPPPPAPEAPSGGPPPPPPPAPPGKLRLLATRDSLIRSRWSSATPSSRPRRPSTTSRWARR
jgi:hypothetical protein